jgi:tetratricopeptide (TPR) repeat protein
MISRNRYVRSTVLLIFLVVGTSVGAFAQSRVNTSGTGGIHEIRGRIYLPNGRSTDTPTTVQLESTNFPTITVESDRSGSFSFRALAPGNYSVVIAATDQFETAREYVTIDADIGVASGSTKIITVPVFLRLKRSVERKNAVVNAKWASVPRDVIERYNRALELIKENKSDQAEAELRNAIAAAPKFAPAYTALGRLELRAGKFEKSVESLKLAVQYDAEDFDANVSLGIAYFNLNKMNEAEPFLVNAAYLNGFSVLPHYYLGLIFSVRNDADVAQKAFEKVKELDGGKSFPVIHKYLGRIYLHKQMNKAAVAEFEAYLSLLPTAKDAEVIRKEISDIKTRPNPTKYAPA